MIAWKNGARVNVDAEVANDEFEKIRRKNGELTAEAVVQDAKRKRSPLHGEFEWDDAAAATLQRKSRAEELIRWIVVTVDEDEEGDHPVRKWSREKPSRAAPSYYDPIEDVLADPNRRALLIQDALNKLLQWRMQYRHLNELGIVFNAHDALKEELATTN